MGIFDLFRRNYLKAYPKSVLGFKDRDAKEGDLYYLIEKRWLKTIVVTYELIGEFWIERKHDHIIFE